MSCTDVTPISAFKSTNLTSQINSFERLGQRIVRAMGAPMINIEIHSDQLYENISIACEMYTKYAGYTTEYLVFDSNLYTPNKGIKLDELFSITPHFNRKNTASSTVYVSTSSINSTFFTNSTALSTTYVDGIYVNQILNQTDYNTLVTFNSAASLCFTPSQPQASVDRMNTFDYDTMDYRKVISVIDLEEGSTTGVNTLFTVEQTLAQQTYFSYSMGNYGFDLISWYILKDWLKVREKMLAQKRAYTFDERTQYLVIHPSPGTGQSHTRFHGIVACYVERPLRDVIKEMWVYQYALALSKISVGNVRSKYQGTNLFGGGQLNSSLLDQGLNEKEKLENALLTGSTPGYDAEPPMFFVG